MPALYGRQNGRRYPQQFGDAALSRKAIDKVVFTERGCVEDQPQHPETARVLRLVPL